VGPPPPSSCHLPPYPSFRPSSSPVCLSTNVNTFLHFYLILSSFSILGLCPRQCHICPPTFTLPTALVTLQAYLHLPLVTHASLSLTSLLCLKWSLFLHSCPCTWFPQGS
jgi:hypothetical protein